MLGKKKKLDGNEPKSSDSKGGVFIREGDVSIPLEEYHDRIDAERTKIFEAAKPEDFVVHSDEEYGAYLAAEKNKRCDDLMNVYLNCAEYNHDEEYPQRFKGRKAADFVKQLFKHAMQWADNRPSYLGPETSDFSHAYRVSGKGDGPDDLAIVDFMFSPSTPAYLRTYETEESGFHRQYSTQRTKLKIDSGHVGHLAGLIELFQASPLAEHLLKTIEREAVALEPNSERTHDTFKYKFKLQKAVANLFLENEEKIFLLIETLDADVVRKVASDYGEQNVTWQQRLQETMPDPSSALKDLDATYGPGAGEKILATLQERGLLKSSRSK